MSLKQLKVILKVYKLWEFEKIPNNYFLNLLQDFSLHQILQYLRDKYMGLNLKYHY